MQECSGSAIKHIVEAVAAGDHYQLAAAGIDQHRHVGRIPVVDIVRSELEMPAELAGIGIQSDQRAGGEIVTLAAIAIVVGAGIAGAPVDQIESRVVGAGDPSGRATGFPAIALPGVMTGLTGTGHRPEAPEAAAGLRVVSVQETAN